MMHVSRRTIGLLAAFQLLAACARGEESTVPKRVLTHADAAVILAKYSGYFDRYVEKEAAPKECITFLNQTGIYFGLMEVVNGSEFTKEDCARAMGQIDLVLSGEAEYIHGKVKLPKGIESWHDFCIMNGVRYVEGYQAMLAIIDFGDDRKE